MANGIAAGWLMAWALGVAALSPALAQVPALVPATETLRASLDEWRREDAAYRSARSAARISPRESEEYAGYVAGLRLRVLEQCEIVRGLGGEEAVKDFDCVRTGAEPRRAVAVVPPAAVLTEEEKRAALQARLDALEGDIDEDLQKRQQEIRQTSTGSGRGTGAGGGAAGGGAAGSGSGKEAGKDAGKGTTWSNPEATASSEKDGSSAAGSASSPPSASSSGPATTGRPGTGGRQASRDGGSDDDVVARQLREAAEKETDPVLKEKLWAEYRKYKEGKK